MEPTRAKHWDYGGGPGTFAGETRCGLWISSEQWPDRTSRDRNPRLRRNTDEQIRALERKVLAGGTDAERQRLCAWWDRARKGKPIQPPRKPKPQERPVPDTSAEGGWSQVVKFEARTHLKDDSESANQRAVLPLRDLSEESIEALEEAAPAFSQNDDNNGEIRRATILDMHYGSYADLTGEDWWYYLVRVEGRLFDEDEDEDDS
jgi:hypothetical protein